MPVLGGVTVASNHIAWPLLLAAVFFFLTAYNGVSSGRETLQFCTTNALERSRTGSPVRKQSETEEEEENVGGVDGDRTDWWLLSRGCDSR